MKKNKVKFKLRCAYYSKATIADDGEITYAAPVRIPGAVSLSLSPEGDTVALKADACDYYVGASNNGYSGDAEFALIPDSFKTDCIGETKVETDNVYLEHDSAQPSPFAFLFEFEGDVKNTRHVLYMCYASRPAVEAENPDNREPKTESLTIKAVPREIDGLIKAKTGEDTPDTTYNGWYTNVYVPSES